MFNIDFLRVTTAAVGALVLAAVSVAAAVGPAHPGAQGGTSYASFQSGAQAHG
jgi:hypothetical protein